MMKENLVVGIIDYKINNILSVYNGVQKLGYKAKIIKNNKDKGDYNYIILPGVGSFGAAMNNLNSTGLSDFIRKKALVQRIPFLGICLGMQLMADDSIELNYNKGLSLIEGNILKLNTKFRIPHIGWNNVILGKKSHLFKGIADKSNFYFVHSYYYNCKQKYIIGKVDYGNKFTAAIQNNNIFGVQFHPERSQRVGLELLKNFLEYKNK